MCGIVGFVNSQKNKKKIIKKMADRIIHRGPDDEGYYVDDFIALGHRRLSIIDLNNGKQPIFNETEDVVVVFNGEIYNYKELKNELVAKKHQFKTTTDTEVLVHGYEEFGYDLPKKLRGMFAYAIYDKKKKILFCSRDNFGIKPFYYCQFNNTFMFASEIKSFLEHPDFVKEFNKDLLGPYLTFSFTPTTETFFKNVYRLDPGYSLIYENNEITLQKYYEIDFQEEKLNLAEAAQKIDEVMKDSVKHHLESDVEVGSYLSSGIDSSYIVALAKPNKTYTVGYDIPKYTETNYAKDLASKLKIENVDRKINEKEYLKIVPKIMYHMDEPISDPAAIALYFLSEIASKDIKVVLSGEGADEFFGGYNTYRETIDMNFYNKIPYFIRHAIALILNFLPEFRGRNFLVRRGMKLEDNYIGMSRVFSDKECQKVLNFTSKIKNKDLTKDIFQKYKNKNDLIKMQAIDINFWLVKDILQKADRMSMANSLELRVPFIDKEVFSLASSLTMDMKVTKENTKVALREAAKKSIPTEAYKKKKLGFPVPLRSWINLKEYQKEITKTFKSEHAKLFFNQDYILKLLNKCHKEDHDTYKKVWAIYTFLKWYEVFFLDKKKA